MTTSTSHPASVPGAGTDPGGVAVGESVLPANDETFEGVSPRPSVMLAACSLWKREMTRFFRQRNRVIGALATPLVIWLLIGFGLRDNFSIPVEVAEGATGAVGVNYAQYFFPGIVSMMVLFTAIFTTISVIEDRKEGFLQGVLVSPSGRSAIVWGKVLGGASIATIQGIVLLSLWPLLGQWPGVLPMLGAVAAMFVMGMCLTAVGLCFAWPMDSVAGFHAVMNLVLMPMWVLSGAMFPVDRTPVGLQLFMWPNPVTYGQTLFAQWMTGGAVQTGAPVPAWAAAVIMLVFTAVMIFFALAIVARPRGNG